MASTTEHRPDTASTASLPHQEAEPCPPQVPRIRGCRSRPADEREDLVALLYARLHPVVAVLGVLFLVIVLGQAAATPGTPLHTGLVVTTWVLWAVFVAEYVLRLVIAPETVAFLRRTWWQILFLAVPVLSVLRALLVLRVARPTRVLLAAVRGTRSARSRLSSRLAWLAAVSVIVVFVAADLVYGAGDITPYGRALHATAKAAIAGEAMPAETGLVVVLDVALGIYAMVVFATLAGTLGAYFFEHREEQRTEVPGPDTPR